MPYAPVLSPLPVTETNPVIVTPVFRPANSTHTGPTITAVSQVILPINLNRRRLIIYNDAASQVFIMFGPVCSPTSFSVRLATNTMYDGPLGDYTGAVSAVRSSGTSVLQVTEITT